MATSAYGLQLTFINNRNYPGGVIVFLGVEFALPANIVSMASYIASNILADGLMVSDFDHEYSKDMVWYHTYLYT